MRSIICLAAEKYKAVIGLSKMSAARLLAVGITEYPASNCSSLKCKAVIDGSSRISYKVVGCPEERK